MAFLFGRMAMDSPIQFSEQMGDPVTNIGGAPVPAVRSALRHAVDVPTFTSPVAEDTPERRFRLRRQLRSLLNNTSYKMLGIYLIWDEDAEQSGWYIPDQGQLAAGADSPLTHGFFKIENFVWFKIGALRTHRAAIGLSIKDLRGGLWARDILRRVYSTDFGGLNSLALTYLHAGATDVANAINQQYAPTTTLDPGLDGGENELITGQADLTVLSYEIAQANRNLGDVLVYDRRGLAGLPEEGAGTNLAPNPSLEYGTTGWEVTGPFLNGESTLTSSTAQYFSGSHSLQVVTKVSSNNNGASLQLPGTYLAGITYTATVYAKGNAGGEVVLAKFGTFSDKETNVNETLVSNAWRRLVVTWKPKETHTSGVAFAVGDTTASAQTFFLDAAQVTEGNSEIPYFDGDTTGYIWTGPKGNSPSTIQPQYFGWEEIYGPDYPFTAAEVPVLDNGLVRVVWTTAAELSGGGPGFLVYAWNGTEYSLRGKLRLSDIVVIAPLVNLVGVSIKEYTPERAVLQVQLISPEATNRASLFITLQRGWSGPRFELYPAPVSGTEGAGAIDWELIPLDTNTSVVKFDAAGATDVSSAGLAELPSGPVGTGTFATTGENQVAILRQNNTFQESLAVVQAKVNLATRGTGLGINRNAVEISNGPTIGYLSVQLNFRPLLAQQILEAESMNLGTGTTSVADAEASGGKTTHATRTTDANFHISQNSWPNEDEATYRIFARVKTSASTLKIYAKIGPKTGVTKETASTTYVWLDLGEIPAAISALEIHCWAAAAATVSVDRIEAVCTEDRQPLQGYLGARDLGQAVLTDSRVTPTVVTRS